MSAIGAAPARALPRLLLLAGVAVWALTLVRYLGSPLRFDEVEWPAQAEGILLHGVPKLLFAEERIVWDHGYYGYDAHYGMWHPPAYLYSLAAAGRLLGFSSAAMRAVGLAWFLLSLALGLAIAGALVPPERRRTARLAALGLVLLCPLLAQGSLFLDIDNTCLASFLLLFAWLFVRRPESTSPLRTLLLALAFGLALWSKLTTPLLALGAVFLFHLLDRRPGRAFGQTLAVGGLGGLLFAGSYLAYCRLLDYPARFMLDISYWGKRDAYSHFHSLWSALRSLRWHVVWISPALTLVLAATAWLRAREWRRTRRVEAVDFLVLFALLTLVVYVPWGGLIGKYAFPGVFAGLLAAAVELARRLPELAQTRPRLLAVLGAALLAVHLAAVPALEVRPAAPRSLFPGGYDSLFDLRNLALAGSLAAFALFAAVARRGVEGGSRGGRALALAAVYALAVNPVDAVKLALPADDRAPLRPFEDRGFEPLVQRLDAELAADAVILAPKDVGWSLRCRYYPIEDVVGFEGAPRLLVLAASGRVVAVVDSDLYPLLPDPAVRARLDALGEAARIGDFTVWHLAPRGPASGGGG